MCNKMERFGIKNTNWERILKTLRANGKVIHVLLFGSRAKGTYKPGSDIDICLKGNDLNNSDILTLKTAVDALDLPWQIDLVHYDTLADPAVKEHIDRVGIILGE